MENSERVERRIKSYEDCCINKLPHNCVSQLSRLAGVCPNKDGYYSIKNMNYFVGIDPGQKGAIAILHERQGKLSINELTKLPMHNVWGHETVNLKALRQTIDINCPIIGKHQKINILIEKVTSYKQGNKSAFNFGANSLGMASFLLSFELYNVKSVTPAAWKKALGLTAAKEKSILLAKNFFPELDRDLSHDESEALLLAYVRYCAK